MEVEYPTFDPLKPNLRTISHYKPYKISKEPTFEFKVIYMRLVSSSDMQSCMNLVFPPRDLHTLLQINGCGIHPNKKTSRPLNKHREDAFMSESVYVNTDRIKFKGKYLPFEVQIQGSSLVLVSGVLRRKGRNDQLSGGRGDCMWVMECEEGSVKETTDGGSLDVYVAGRSLGKPLLLNEVVELKGWKELGCIPEGDEGNSEISSKESGVKPPEEYESNDEHHNEEEEVVGEEGELSLFNAGLRVGIGLGFGVSLGVGVGLGLIIRTYKTASGVVRKLAL